VAVGSGRGPCPPPLHNGVHGHREPALTADPGVVRLELSVGDATCALEPAEIRTIFAELAGTGEGPGT
jgi:hypothetical protein